MVLECPVLDLNTRLRPAQPDPVSGASRVSSPSQGDWLSKHVVGFLAVKKSRLSKFSGDSSVPARSSHNSIYAGVLQNIILKTEAQNTAFLILGHYIFGQMTEILENTTITATLSTFFPFHVCHMPCGAVFLCPCIIFTRGALPVSVPRVTCSSLPLQPQLCK